MLFIDTHIVVWLYQNYLDYLTEAEREALEKNDIYISPIAMLEIEYLFEIGRIKKNSMSIIEYLSDRIDLMIDNIDFLDLAEIALKEKWTRDPFDRIIVSQAKYRKSYLLTRDKVIRKNYSRVV